MKLYTGYFSKKFPIASGAILSQSQAFFTESNQSQSSIHVNIMVPCVTGNFLLKHPVYIRHISKQFLKCVEWFRNAKKILTWQH